MLSNTGKSPEKKKYHVSGVEKLSRECHLLGELGTVDGLTTTAITAGEVTTLGHEAGDDAVELGALVGQGHARELALASITNRQGTEVLGGLGDNVVEELEGHATS